MAVYFDPDAIDSSLILGSGVLMIGYGNQGRAQALNLRDSGVRVSVGLYPGSKSWSKAVADGFEPVIAAEAVSEHDFLVLCTPDMKMESVYREAVAPHLRPAAALCFSHGFNIRYGLIVPPPEVDVVMVSPKGAGYGVRGRYEAGSGVPGLIAVHQDATGQALNRALSYAWGIGCARSVLLETTFAEETESDLFGEQAVLCGGIPDLIRMGYETLVEAGVQPEIAYFECLHETKLIVDLIVERGLAGMRSAISDTAQWGGLTAGPKVLTPETRQVMRRLLAEIRDGSFAERWVQERDAGYPELNALKREEAATPVEEVGKALRHNMREAEGGAH
ncbi:MAG: ketol-acid reductoisomerase [Fimbriimonadaceae bacterium]|nr:MAG: ketol-acid reductoisomerase [Fimbriimonadaceae bacterium]